MQRTGKGAGYEVPAKVLTVAGFLQLMLDLLSDKEAKNEKEYKMSI